jgi:hypothetical protein
MRRLRFILPEFFRYAWTTEKARAVWEPRFDAVGAAVSDLQWLTVAAGQRSCGLARFSPDVLMTEAPRWVARGIQFLPVTLEAEGMSRYEAVAPAYVPGRPFRFSIGFGQGENLLSLKTAIIEGDDEAAGRLFGYPPCCREFFQESWRRRGHVDTVWLAATATASGIEGAEIDSGETIRLTQPSLSNILLRGLGIRAVLHLPCRFDCAGSLEFAEQFIEVGKKHGFSQEMDWLRQILSWPMEWSALHGIAEIRTPILKCSMRTDATASTCKVLFSGWALPEEAAAGIGHAYRSPRRNVLTQLTGLSK